MEEEKSPMQYSKCSDRITEKVERKEMCILKEQTRLCSVKACVEMNKIINS